MKKIQIPTIERFFELFSRTAKRYKWELYGSGVRTKKDRMCPLACLIKDRFKKFPGNGVHCIKEYIDSPVILNITEFADYYGDGVSPNDNRAKLLTLTRLK